MTLVLVLLVGCLGGAYKKRGQVRVQRRNRAFGFYRYLSDAKHRHKHTTNMVECWNE